MSVALCFMFQSDPGCNLTKRKSDKHSKHRLFFSFDTKFICQHSDGRQQSTEYENKSTILDKVKQTVIVGYTQTLISFLFAAVVLQVLRLFFQGCLAQLTM